MVLIVLSSILYSRMSPDIRRAGYGRLDMGYLGNRPRTNLTKGFIMCWITSKPYCELQQLVQSSRLKSSLQM